MPDLPSNGGVGCCVGRGVGVDPVWHRPSTPLQLYMHVDTPLIVLVEDENEYELPLLLHASWAASLLEYARPVGEGVGGRLVGVLVAVGEGVGGRLVGVLVVGEGVGGRLVGMLVAVGEGVGGRLVGILVAVGEGVGGTTQSISIM